MMYRHSAYATKVFDGKTVSAGATEYSPAINMKNLEGFFSVSVEVTGSGTLTLKYEISDDNGVTFYTPTEASDITTSLDSSSGPNSDGKDKFSFDPQVGMQLRLKAIETGTTDSATITARLVAQ